MQLAYKSYGASGEPLVILHGLFGSNENWHPMSLRLSPQFQVFALDQRNHGESPHANQMDYSAMAGDVHEFIRAHNLAPCHLLGHSMGAKTAMQLALNNPAAVQSLISVDMAPRAYAPRHRSVLEALLALNLASFSARKEIEDALQFSIPDLSTRKFLLKNVRREQDGSFYWRIGLNEISNNYEQLTRGLESLAPCSRPALFVRGELSDYLANTDLPGIRQLFSTAELISVPNSGHLPHVENPDFLFQVVSTFLHGHSW